jgi:hypothetical protein
MSELATDHHSDAFGIDQSEWGSCRPIKHRREVHNALVLCGNSISTMFYMACRRRASLGAQEGIVLVRKM